MSFLDPNPDPAASWGKNDGGCSICPAPAGNDYDKSLISEGGGVYKPRTQKPFRSAIRSAPALNIEDDVTEDGTTPI